jgi:hypothetical protein
MRSKALLPALGLCVVLAAACSEFPTRPGEVVADRDAGGDVGEDGEGTGDGVCSIDAACDDGQFCNGMETCAPDHPTADEKGCVAGSAPPIDDDIACTRDGCDENNDRVLHDPSSCACLTPGTACDCDSDQAACPEEVPLCHEVICTTDLTCAVAPVTAGKSCDDGVPCTQRDVCTDRGTCIGTPTDTVCGDNTYCNGAEVCSPNAPGADGQGCLPGTPVPIDDGLDCTEDSCDEAADEVLHIGRDCQMCDEASECVVERQVACRVLVCNAGVCATEAAREGSVCDDSFSCTGGDACTADGICSGVPDDAACIDERWCDGIESCQPQDPGRDAGGCVPGPAPVMPDGVECTTDVCVECEPDTDRVPGEEGAFAYFPTDACDCQGAQDCQATQCNVPVCDPITFTCGARRAEVGTSCVGLDPCIESATCDADGACVGGVNVCECRGDDDCPAPGVCRIARCVDRECTEILAGEGAQCDSDDPCVVDARCDAGGQCTGPSVCECQGNDDCALGACEESVACVQGECVALFAQPGVSCAAPVGCIEHQCDGLGECLALPIDSFCSRACNEGSCLPDDPQANQDGCVSAGQSPDGASCEDDCRGGPTGGVCWDGTCLPVPEGPTGTQECGDNRDNDCDGAEDEVDTDCRTASVVELVGVSQLPVGLGVSTTALTLAALDGNRAGLTNQQDNAYCVARHVDIEYGFESGTVAGDDLIEPTPGAVLGVDVADGVEQATGMGLRLCNGHGVEIGPLPFPDPDTNLTYMVELEVAQELEAPLLPDEHLVVAFRTDESPSGEFHPLVALTDTLVSSSEGRYQFVFDNVAGMNQITLRLQSMVQGQGRCAFVTTLRIYSMPRIARDGQEPQWREHLTWLYGDTREAAFQAFNDDVDPNVFVQEVMGDVSAYIDVDGAMIGATGLEWKYSNGDFGLVTLPELVAHPPIYDRSDLLMFDFAAFDDDANYGSHREVWHMSALDNESLRILASVVPRDVSWIEHHDDLDNPEMEHHRYLVPLPEDMKVLGASTLSMFALFQGIRDADVLADELHVYWFSRPRVEDLSVQVAPAVQRDGRGLQVLVNSARPGFVLVRCYWQIPDDPDSRTVESDPHYVLFR